MVVAELNGLTIIDVWEFGWSVSRNSGRSWPAIPCETHVSLTETDTDNPWLHNNIRELEEAPRYLEM
jgi:hypothetical protein